MATPGKTIYCVTTAYEHETSTLGYATGSPEDIRNYYEDGRGRHIDIKPIEIIDITPEMIVPQVKERQLLLEQKKNLEMKIKEIEQRQKKNLEMKIKEIEQRK